jgi:hypothetical protein
VRHRSPPIALVVSAEAPLLLMAAPRWRLQYCCCIPPFTGGVLKRHVRGLSFMVHASSGLLVKMGPRLGAEEAHAKAGSRNKAPLGGKGRPKGLLESSEGRGAGPCTRAAHASEAWFCSQALQLVRAPPPARVLTRPIVIAVGWGRPVGLCLRRCTAGLSGRQGARQKVKAFAGCMACKAHVLGRSGIEREGKKYMKTHAASSAMGG